MKFSRILALVIAGMMLALTFVSCGELPPKINVTLQIEDPAEEGAYILDVAVPLETKDPTVLMAFLEGCIVNEIKYTLSTDEKSVESIEDYASISAANSEDGLEYFWAYFLNGQEPQGGRASEIAIADGDVITFYLDSFNPEEVELPTA